MRKTTVEGVDVFVVAAQVGSFSEAARRLGLSPSAVSQAIRGLEARLGVTLFHRSTRSLGLTEVGRKYLEAVAPAMLQLRQAAEDVAGQVGRPTGPLRLTMPRAPFELVVAPMLLDFHTSFPDVELEIAVEARLVDIVKEGYDGGVRYGNHLDNDMVAVQLAPRSEAVLAAAPAYLQACGVPSRPEDLLGHRAIMCRSQSTGMPLPWKLQSAREAIQISPSAAMIVHDLASQIGLSVRGLGIVSAPAAMVSKLIDRRQLVRVLPAWFSPLDGIYLYFLSRRHQSAALRAFISFFKRRADGG